MTDFQTLVTRRRALLAVAGLWPVAPWAAARTAAADPGAPAIELLSLAPSDIDPGGYLVSEKFDGVRAIWDGRGLRFRSGRAMAAPGWFTEGWPDTALDGAYRAQTMPNSTLSGDANLLVLPNIDAANISYNLLKTAAGGGIAIGPVLLGAAKPVHVLTPSATVRRIVNMTALTVADANAAR